MAQQPWRQKAVIKRDGRLASAQWLNGLSGAKQQSKEVDRRKGWPWRLSAPWATIEKGGGGGAQLARIGFGAYHAIRLWFPCPETQIRKYAKDGQTLHCEGSTLKWCICLFVLQKKVFFLPQYADTHTKWPFFNLCIRVFIFVVWIEGPFFLSFWNTSECANAKKDAK